MNHSQLAKPIAALVMALGAGLAQADSTPVNLDFTGTTGSFSSYLEDGYQLTAATANGLTSTVYTQKVGKTTTVTNVTMLTSGFTFSSATPKGEFRLTSLDLDNQYTNANGNKIFGGTVTLAYTLADGVTGKTALTLDSGLGLQNFSESLGPLLSFTLTAIDTKNKSAPFQVDNITVQSVPQATAVPEPGALALLVAGVGVVATLARRRRA